VLDVLPAAPQSAEVMEALPVVEVAPADRLAGCRLLRGRAFWLRTKTSTGHSLDYSISDPDSSEVLGIAQDDSDRGGLLEALVQKGSQARTAVIYDAATDKPILVVHREAFRQFLGVKPARVDICDHKERLLGWFETKPFPAKGAFPLFDHRDRQIAELEGKWYPEPDYDFWGKNDAKLGRVSAEGEVRRLFTAQLSWCKRGGALLLTVSKDLAGDPRTKALLLATMLTLEQFGGSVQLPHMR
jgi:hypothetical protein